MSAPHHINNVPPRRAMLAWLFTGALTGVALPVMAASRTLPLSASLQDELARALAGGQPLVVLVSLKGCHWCDEVRNNYLAPMHADQGLPVVQLDMRSSHATRTLQGQPVTHDALVRAWEVTVAPTVLFLGRGGKEVADRLAGSAPDFYHAYLQRRLELARKAVTG